MRESLIGPACSAAGVVFAMGTFLYIEGAGPAASPLGSFLATAIGAVVGLTILLAVLFSSTSAAGTPRDDPENASGIPDVSPRVQTRRFLRRHSPSLIVFALLVVVVSVFGSIQVSEAHDSGMTHYSLTFGRSYPPCNFSIYMEGFGQILFNWSEPSGGGVVISVIAHGGTHLLELTQSLLPVQGYEGLVVAPGVYNLLISPGTTSQTTVFLGLEVSYTVGQNLLSSVGASHGVEVTTSNCAYG